MSSATFVTRSGKLATVNIGMNNDSKNEQRRLSIGKLNPTIAEDSLRVTGLFNRQQMSFAKIMNVSMMDASFEQVVEALTTARCVMKICPTSFSDVRAVASKSALVVEGTGCEG
jgi:hypothetical protein